MIVCDETLRDFEISNNSRVIKINIYQVHPKELENCYSNEFDLPENVLSTDHDIIIPIYYTINTSKYAKRIDLCSYFIVIKDISKLMGANGKRRTYSCKHCVQPFSNE
jgi:hypothetical protein